MYILSFDTSSGIASSAVSDGERILGYARQVNRSMQAENLLSLIDESMRQARLQLDAMEHIAITKGPGSFTGVRIGLAAARGLCLATQIPAIALTNFDLCFFRSKRQVLGAKHHVAIINAYRSQCYLQCETNGVLYPPELVDHANVLNIIQQLDGIVAVSGDYLLEVYNDLKSYKNVVLLPRFAAPDAKNICRAVYSKFVAGETYNAELTPLYIRKPDAKLPKQL